MWEGGGKLQKIEYLVNEKTFSKFLIGNHIMEKKKKWWIQALNMHFASWYGPKESSNTLLWSIS